MRPRSRAASVTVYAPPHPHHARTLKFESARCESEQKKAVVSCDERPGSMERDVYAPDRSQAEHRTQRETYRS